MFVNLLTRTTHFICIQISQNNNVMTVVDSREKKTKNIPAVTKYANDETFRRAVTYLLCELGPLFADLSLLHRQHIIC